ncbi:MAG: two-component system sensor histidine kinase NtrB [Candidatus Binatia bacterium]
MESTKRWDLWGLAAGVLIGLFDLSVLLALGVDMRLGDRVVTVGVSLFFMANYAILGLVIGKLIQARARARADARTIEVQLHALETSQRAALQNEKLAAIGRLAAGIAHEVRNPLGVIRASASMVQEHFAPDDEAYRACEFIREEINRLNGLITSLLTFARPADLRLQAVVIEQVIDRALQLTAEELRRRSVVITRDRNAALPEATVDPDLIAQVILSLVLNAAEAVGEQGRIIIRLASDDDEVYVEVADTGPGVSPADMERIFEPFFTTKSTGTGLGLPMAARIIRAHGGLIEVVPGSGAGENGDGACFRVRLPLAGPAVLQERAA